MTSEIRINKLSDEDKNSTLSIVNRCIDIFTEENISFEIQCFAMGKLIESFEEVGNCLVPFKNRYKKINITQE